jgi:hypothetical protein
VELHAVAIVGQSVKGRNQNDMGVAHYIDDERKGIIIVWDGRVSADEHFEHVLRIAEDPRWPPTRYSVTDLSTVTAMTVPNAQALDALVEDTDIRDRVEQVIVVRPGLDYEQLSKAARSLGLNPKFFVDLDEASVHLGVEPATVRTTVAKLRSKLATQDSR